MSFTHVKFFSSSMICILVGDEEPFKSDVFPFVAAVRVLFEDAARTF